MKTAFVLTCVILIASARIISCQDYSRRDGTRDGLSTLVDGQVDRLGSTNLDERAVTAIHKLGQEYLRAQSFSGDEEVKFLFSQLNQQLLEEEKRELTIKILLGELSSKHLQPEQCAVVERFLSRQLVGSLDSALIGCMLKSEMDGNHLLSGPNWNAILRSYLSPQDYVRTALARWLIARAEAEHKLDSPTLDIAWTDQEKQEIADASLAAQRRILARRHLEGIKAK